MARLARIVAAGVGHHITQRGNRRQTVFFSDDDYRAYLGLLREWSEKEGLAIWAKRKGICPRYIQPGKPQQNGYVERYNRTVRYDWLNQYLFESLEEIQDFATSWLWSYNNERPNMGIGGITPAMKLKQAA